MNAFSPRQTRALKEKLDRKNVHTRMMEGREIDYIEGWFAVAEANAIFGFGGWDRETVQIERLFERMKGEQAHCGYLARVRITVRAGEIVVVREGTGCGSATSKIHADAHERAIKMAETDATKRALSTFGNRFGLSLYDKDQNGVSGSRMSWVIYDPCGQPFVETLSAESFCGTFRQLIEQAKPEELPRWRERNKDALTRLRHVQDLKNASGLHYADILERLITARLKEHGIQAKESAPELNLTAPGLAPSKIAAGGRIDKASLAIGTERRYRDKEHLKHVAAMPCLICARQPAHAHHLKFVQRRGLSQKVSDEFAVPLCSAHHDEIHRASDEQGWWQAKGIDPLPIAASLWQRRLQAGDQKDQAGIKLGPSLERST